MKWDGSACIMGAPLTQKTTYVVREKMFTFGGDFDIKDDKGNICFKIKGKVWTFRDVMTFRDINGVPICVL